MLAHVPDYETRAALCKRPEELDQTALFSPIWPAVNAHLGHLGIKAHSHQELVKQLGILRFGHRPRVGDTFCGGGSIPFEAARLGCDVYASDLNPIACMLTWGALNIIGASPEKQAEIERAQREVAEAVDREITALGIEHDRHGNRAKAYLYCLEVLDTDTGWRVPMAPSWVISKNRNVIAKPVPDYANCRFDIQVLTGVSIAEMKTAEQGTVRDGNLVYELDGKRYLTPLGALIVAIQEFLADREPEVVMANLRDAVPDCLHRRPLLIDLAGFIAAKTRGQKTRRAGEAIASRLRNQRLQ